MKDLIKQAVARAAQQQKVVARPSAPVVTVPPRAGMDRRATSSNDAADSEIEKVLGSMVTRIKVIGCGGGGTNTVARCFEEGITNCEFVAVNTDAQHLLMIKAPKKVLIGKHITRGLGAGALPQIGEEAALEAETEIRKHLQGADMAFITCGLGGGTGTGSAPVVAKIAKDVGALTIVIATLPFSVEGAVRLANAEAGLARLRAIADTVIVVPNDKLLEIAPRLPITAAFKVADELLMRSIKGITELITKPGIVNLDFADLKTVLRGGGVAMIGMGEASGDNRAQDAIREALHSPLLDIDIGQANGALVNVIGGPDMTIKESESVVEEIYNRIDPDARIIWGTSVDPSLDHTLRVMVVMTGVKSNQILGPGTRTRADARKKSAGIDFVL